MAQTTATEDDYFNDLSRQPNSEPKSTPNPSSRPDSNVNRDDNVQPKAKRVACVICRKRKLKCDGSRPSCGTCSRLGHNCAYDEVRRKSGPKRGYVKELEARLAQVETQLKTKDNESPPRAESSSLPATTVPSGTSYPAFDPSTMNVDMSAPMDGLLNTSTFDASPSINMIPDIDLAVDENFSWEMIGLGLEEPLPSQEAIDELTDLYFEKIHPSIPIIHKYRFFAGMNLSPHMRPAICLRYAMWASAASVSERFSGHQDILYRRARKYAELDEMRGAGESIVTVAHAQVWSLISMYEFKMMYFPRAWMSVARACRLSLMMGMNRMDGMGIDVKQCLPPPRDWTEREERRRAFWMAYCSDRFASVGTGWPMMVDEKDIMSNLPASEEAYQSSTPQTTQSLMACMTPQGAGSISSFAGVVFMAHFFGKNLHHLHRPGADEREDDLQGEFWKRHRNLDNILLHKSLSLPPHLRLPNAIRDPNAIFINMAIHTSTITLHQAAIFKAEKNDLPAQVIEQSQTRCTLAATEIANILKLISHLDTGYMNPYLPFCLYVAARVFVQFLRKVSEDSEIQASLEFLLTAMQWLKKHNPLSESFLVQLGFDIRGSGLDTLLHNPDLTSSNRSCGLQSVEEMYCALDPKQNTNGGFPDNAPAGGCPNIPIDKLAAFCGPSVAQKKTFDVPSHGSRPEAYGNFPDRWEGGYGGPAGIFPGGFHADHPKQYCDMSEREKRYGDMPGSQSPDSNLTPSGLTPGESHNASSATSYSPRQENDLKTTQSDFSSAVPSFYTFPSREGTQVTDPSGSSGRDTSSNSPFPQSGDPKEAFGFPSAAWNVSLGNTPLPSGITPPAMDNWANPSALPIPVWSRKPSMEEQQQQQQNTHYGFNSGYQ